MNRKRLLKGLIWLAAIGLLVLVLVNVPLADTLNALRDLTWQQVVFLIAINVIVLGLLNARWWIILRGYGYKLPFGALFGYRLATFGVSYFTPGPHFGGEPLQVLLVEKEQQTPRSTAIAAMTLDKSLELLINFLFLLTGVLLIVQQQLLSSGIGAGVALIIFLLLLVPAGYLLAIAQGRSPLWGLSSKAGDFAERHTNHEWQDRFQRASGIVQSSEEDIGRFLNQSPVALILAVLVSVAAWLLMIIEFWLMVSFLGASMTPIQLVTALTAARLAILLFLPAGLGALEASQALAFGMIGLNPALGISASLLIRARDVLLGGIGLWWGSRKLSGQYSTDTDEGQKTGRKARS